MKAWLAAMTREEVRAILVRALEQEAGCVRAASDRLGITKMAVSVMVRKHGLQQDVARVREAAARRFRLL